MADTKKGRNKKSRNVEDRQRERELAEARDRDDEAEPPQDAADEAQYEAGESCHRRGCSEQAAFVVVERYQEETGKGAVEATATLCREHTAEESPANLEGVYADYLFCVEALPGTGDTEPEN